MLLPKYKREEDHKLEINRQSKKTERLPQFLADTAHTFRLNPWLLELDSSMVQTIIVDFLDYYSNPITSLCLFLMLKRHSELSCQVMSYHTTEEEAVGSLMKSV